MPQGLPFGAHLALPTPFTFGAEVDPGWRETPFAATTGSRIVRLACGDSYAYIARATLALSFGRWRTGELTRRNRPLLLSAGDTIRLWPLGPLKDARPGVLPENFVGMNLEGG